MKSSKSLETREELIVHNARFHVAYEKEILIT